MGIGFFLAANIFWIALLIERLFIGWYSGVTLVEYQRGILYRRGLPVENIGAGRQRIWTGIDKVIQLDARPIQVNYENQQVGLNDGTVAVFGFTGSAQVSDARKALYSSMIYTQIPAFVLLSCARFVLNGSAASELKLNREAIVAKIAERATPRLAAAGFELVSFRLPQLEIRGAINESAELRD